MIDILDGPAVTSAALDLDRLGPQGLGKVLVSGR